MENGKKMDRPRSKSAKILTDTPAPTQKVEWNFPLHRENLIIAVAGIVIILIGYALMSTGISEDPAAVDGTWNNFMAVTLAPILLVIGYCVAIPYALFKKTDK